MSLLTSLYIQHYRVDCVLIVLAGILLTLSCRVAMEEGKKG